jgi:hypothetical protein
MNSAKNKLNSVGSSERRVPKRNCEICTIIKKLGLPEDVHDSWFCARPLKRAVERLLVQPLSNLMATEFVATIGFASYIAANLRPSRSSVKEMPGRPGKRMGLLRDVLREGM